ncbi:MAG: homoserine dehydrogenase [Candidatus Thioglobus sp.]|nr:MAG: homoserine dehydrogenase [Candidatus Thioglobus sp.]
MGPVNIGVVGLGTVGAGTVQVLQKNGVEISRRAGREIRVTHAAVRNLESRRACALDGIELTVDAMSLVHNPDIDVVLELMGGCEDAYDIVISALRQKKHVVTANKALIATKGNEIFDEASKQGLVVAFEAAVAGGIPIIKAIRESFSGNKIENVEGILNGTCNYILSEIADRGCDYDEVLAVAQDLGYAEADPYVDVEGVDAAHKLTILASIAYGTHLNFESVHVEGIGNITHADISYARELGYQVKHLGIARRQNDALDLRVHPCLLASDQILANVSGVMNAVKVNGDAVGETLFYGAGAGAGPTASAVVADLVDVVRTLTADPFNRVPHLAFQPDELSSFELTPVEDTVTAQYLRLTVVDKPGVLGDVTKILGDEGVSIRAISQKERRMDASAVPVVIVTHQVREGSLTRAIAEIESLAISVAPIVRIRLEE